MAWRIEFDPAAFRELKKIDRKQQSRILKFLRERVSSLDNPKKIGGQLSGPFRQLWKYRVGDYRLICEIRENELVVLVVRIGHRREVYR